MTTTSPFRLIRDEDVTEINARALIYEHTRTGARVLSIVTDDTNKVFGVTFRTPPSDSTGVPHILEHSVLCGSKKYPIKEPFVELLKGSLQTFLNAFTYPDKTCYPVASENLKDFYNLIDVYLDAVFHPRISEEIFQQEGWHYELESRDQPLTYKGVVFNEMKGAYSSPEDVLGEYSQQSLFPDTTYGVESGGHPRHIPDLTYEAFKSFYDTLYHPSNAYVYFYGDDDPEERLRILDTYLSEYEQLAVDSSISLQPRFARSRELEYPFDPGDDSAGGAKAMFTVNWLLPVTTDVDLNLALGVLSYALIATPASPLRKALIESGLGEDLVGAGYAAYMREMYFGTGLRGVLESDIEKAENLIYTTLRTLVRDGLDGDIVEAALNTMEFRLREQNTGGYPRGLAYMIAALTFWLYEEDPLTPLRFEDPLARLRERMTKEPRFFESLIEEHLLTNPHRTRVILRPVPGHNREEENHEQKRLAETKSKLSDSELDAISERARRLKEMQSSPDSPEALATIPFLDREDVDKENRTIPIDLQERDLVRVLYHDLFTNGILYLDVGFDFRVLPERLLPYLSLFGQALLEMGTAKEDYVSLSNRIGKVTGGIGPAMVISARRNNAGSATWFFLRGKAVQARVGDLLSILKDVLTIPRFDDKERFRQIVLEEKAGYEAGIIPGGSSVAGTRMRAGHSEADWVNEQLKGVSYLFFLRNLEARLDAEWDEVSADLEEIRSLLVRRDGLVINATIDSQGWKKAAAQIHEFLSALPAGDPVAQRWNADIEPQPEGLSIPAKVNYVVKGTNLYRRGFEPHGSVLVITNLLRAGYLWDKIRVQGGAYGASCSFDLRSGVFGFGSYRDPNLRDTVKVYDQSAAYLRDSVFDDKELTKNVIGTIGSIDAYRLPDAKGYTSMVRHLVGDTDEQRQQIRDEVLGTNAQHIRGFADALDEVSRHGTVVVIGSQEAIEKAGTLLGDPPRLTALL